VHAMRVGCRLRRGSRVLVLPLDRFLPLPGRPLLAESTTDLGRQGKSHFDHFRTVFLKSPRCPQAGEQAPFPSLDILSRALRLKADRSAPSLLARSNPPRPQSAPGSPKPLEKGAGTRLDPNDQRPWTRPREPVIQSMTSDAIKERITP